MGIFPTPSQTTARTTASCGTTVAGIRHFSTRAHKVVPTPRHTQILNLLGSKRLIDCKNASCPNHCKTLAMCSSCSKICSHTDWHCTKAVKMLTISTTEVICGFGILANWTWTTLKHNYQMVLHVVQRTDSAIDTVTFKLTEVEKCGWQPCDKMATCPNCMFACCEMRQTHAPYNPVQQW